MIRRNIKVILQNIITFFNSFITVRIPQNTCKDCFMSFLFKSHTVLNPSWFPLNVFYFIHFYMAYAQFFLIFLTSLNRFSMIFWSATYEKVFSHSYEQKRNLAYLNSGDDKRWLFWYWHFKVFSNRSCKIAFWKAEICMLWLKKNLFWD